MLLKDDYIGIYVGINDTGKVVQYFMGPDEFENRISSVVSMGYVEAVPIDYDELFNISD